MFRRHWDTESADTPRYAPDGRAFYYKADMRSLATDDWVRWVVVRSASIVATPQIVRLHSVGVPRDIVRTITSASSDHGSVSAPGGRYRAAWRQDDQTQEATLTVTDVRTGASRVSHHHAHPHFLASPQFGWLDDHRFVVSWDDTSVEVADAATGATMTVASTAPGTPFLEIFRVAAYPTGVALFNVETGVDTAHGRDVGSVLYSYDARTDRITRRGQIAEGDSWDYNPSRGTVVFVTADPPSIVEMPLEALH